MALSHQPFHGPDPLKGHLHEIFDPRFFFSSINPKIPDSRAKAVSHLFAYGFVFAEIIELKVVKIGFNWANDPA
jgi:hypothetical protein